MSLDEKFVYFPSRFPDGDWQPRELVFEDAWFRSEDGTTIHGWFCPAENPRAVLLASHGNAGSVTHRADELRSFTSRFGVSVLLYDYRGYGRSEGRPSEPGLIADGRAARRWLAQRTKTLENSIVLHGSSLGGGVAVRLAAEDGARGLILVNTFTSLVDVAEVHYPWAPVRSLMTARFNSLERIADYRGPLLQVHGDADAVVPFKLGWRLFQAANEPKKFVRVVGGDHNDPPGEEYIFELNKFIVALPPA